MSECSTTNLDWVKALGADRVIDYTKEDFTQSGETHDVILDAVRRISSSRSKRSLKEKGVFPSARSSTEERTEGLIPLKELIEAGKLRAVIDRRCPLEQIGEVHRYVEKGTRREMRSPLWSTIPKPCKALPFDFAQEGPPHRYEALRKSGR